MPFHSVIILLSQFLMKIKITTTIIYSYLKNTFLYRISMIYYRMDVSEENDVNKTSKSKEYHICHYWHF